MRACVEVNRYGKQLYIAQRDFVRLLENKHESEPAEINEKRLVETILSRTGHQKIRILSLALTHPHALKALSRICDTIEGAEILQLIEDDQVNQLFSLLSGGIRLTFRKNYDLISVKNNSGFLIKNTIIIKCEDGNQLLILVHKDHERILEINKDTNLFDFCLSMIHANDTGSCKISRRIRRNFPDEYAAFLKECYGYECGKSIFHFKSDVGLEYMPVEIVARNFTEWAAENDARFLPFVETLYALLDMRRKNILEKTEPTYLLMNREDMIRFAETGLLSDHPFCLKPFSPEDRRTIIRELYLAAQNAPNFVPVFLADNTLHAEYSIIGYGDGKLLVCKSGSNYDFSDYTEIIIDSKPLFDHYSDFFSMILLKSHSIGKKASLEFLKLLETKIPGKGV